MGSTFGFPNVDSGNNGQSDPADPGTTALIVPQTGTVCKKYVFKRLSYQDYIHQD